MRDILISANELRGVRFEKLVAYLAEKSAREDTSEFRMIVAGHLTSWYLGWAAEDDYDHGLFFGFSRPMVARWAGWAKPDQFALALLHAEYVKDMTEVYPPEVLDKRTGYVVMGALDKSWGWHRSRKNKQDLALFLLDDGDRADQCRRFDAVRPYVIRSIKGWLELDAPPHLVPEIRGRLADPSYQQGREAAGGRSEEMGSGGHFPPRKIGFDPGAPPRTPLTLNDERKEGSTTAVTMEGGNQRQQPTRTALPSSPEMFEVVRRCRYDNPLAALIATDPSPNFRSWCQNIIRTHRTEVMSTLSEMTESPERFASYGYPARVFTTAVKDKMSGVKRGTRRP